MIGAGGIFGYCGPPGSFQLDPCDWHLEGNPDLSPEESDTTTIGFVFSPKERLAGLQLSVDYFRIKIKEAIQQADVRDTLDGCLLRNDAQLCSQINFDGTTHTFGGVTYPGITSFRALSFNGAGYAFKGLDFSGSWQMTLGNGANLSFRLLAENMWRQEFADQSRVPLPVNIVGQTGNSNSFLADNQPQPKWTGSLTGTYAQGPAVVTAQMRFIGHGIMDYNNPGGGVNASGNPVSPRTEVPSYQVFTLSGMYTFNELGPLGSLQVFGVVDNLFDKEPPFASGITRVRSGE